MTRSSELAALLPILRKGRGLEMASVVSHAYGMKLRLALGGRQGEQKLLPVGPSGVALQSSSSDYSFVSCM